jgi:saccharopine dehydrogenase-like NADP-dependent oxidoreductase
MTKILLLGCGLVGRTIAKDLAKSYLVNVADINYNNLATVKGISNIDTIVLDVSKENELKSVAKQYDIVVSAVPGFLGFRVLKSLIKMGKNVVDISFFPENALELDSIAKSNNVTAVVDCGVAPGLSNIIVGYVSKRMNVHSCKIYVGGLPFRRSLPFEYKAPFSPIDVLEEYIRPARYKKENKVLEIEPLTEIEHIEFDPVGTLEAFLTDGLRTLVHTVDIPNLEEKTLRYPGYAEKIRFLKHCGFLDNNYVETPSGKVRPLELTASLLLPKWKLAPEEPEFTAMRIVFEGKENNKNIVEQYEIFDVYDEINKDTSMGRTTGFVACAVANLLAKKKIKQKGIVPPEFLGFSEHHFDFVLDYLEKRNVRIKENSFEYNE